MENEKYITAIKDILVNDVSKKDDEIFLIDLARIYQNKVEEFKEKEMEVSKVIMKTEDSPLIPLYREGLSNKVTVIFKHGPKQIGMSSFSSGYKVSGIDNKVSEEALSKFFLFHAENFLFYNDFPTYDQDRTKMKDIVISGGNSGNTIRFNLFLRKDGISISSHDEKVDNGFYIKYNFENSKFSNISISSSVRKITEGAEEEFFSKFKVPITLLPDYVRKALDENKEYNNDFTYDETTVADVENLVYDIDSIIDYGVKVQKTLSKIATELLSLSKDSSITKTTEMMDAMSLIVSPEDKPLKRNIIDILFKQYPVEEGRIDIDGLIKFEKDFETNSGDLKKERDAYINKGQILLKSFIPLIEKYIENCEKALNDDKLDIHLKEEIALRRDNLKESWVVAYQALGFLTMQVKTYRETIKKNNKILTVFYPAVSIQATFNNGLLQQNSSIRIENALKGMYYGYLKGNADLVIKNRVLLEEQKKNINDNTLNNALTELIGIIGNPSEIKMLEQEKVNQDEIKDDEIKKVLKLTLPDSVGGL